MVTVHGEVRAGNGVWICSDCWAIFQTLVKSVLKACVSVASPLAFLCGELLPRQASLLLTDGQKIHSGIWVLEVHGASVLTMISVPRIKENVGTVCMLYSL